MGDDEEIPSSSTQVPDQQPFAIDSLLQSTEGDKPPPKKRRIRTSFTQYQLLVLEDAFVRQQYMVKGERTRLAETLGLNQIQVKIWFQNRRIRWRKDQRELARIMGGGTR